MKYIVLTVVGMWFAFLTLMQTFHAWENLLVPNHFSTGAIGIVGVSTLLIGFGYTMLFIALIEAPVPRTRVFTYCMASGFLVFGILAIFSTLSARSTHGNILLQAYINSDMFFRNSFRTTIAWMDYGNTLLLVATTTWWSLVGVILAFVSAPTKNRTWIKRLEVSRFIH